MGNMDQYTYLSKLRLMDPVQKIIFSLMTLNLCLISQSLLLDALVIMIIGYLIIEIGGTPWAIYLRCFLVPLSFLVLSLVTMVLDIGSEGSVFLYKIHVFSGYIGITQAGLKQGGYLFFKVIACVSCLYGLSLSTPITDLLNGLRRMKCPDFLIELMALIYRFIFVMIEGAIIMRQAQESRLGYQHFKVGVRSFGVLLTSSLLQALKMNEQLYIALEARGYTGELKVLNNESYWRISYYKIIGLEMIFLLAIVIDQWLI